MEREEAQHISRQKEEEAKKEVERIEAQLKPLAEARENAMLKEKRQVNLHYYLKFQMMNGTMAVWTKKAIHVRK